MAKLTGINLIIVLITIQEVPVDSDDIAVKLLECATAGAKPWKEGSTI